mmetsp:Transcript_94469/g.250949  ORF Transcript_94469/g.250949 Transcript_94469/m.250949 type:complete len:393 (-) Transcript_94469:136-1314(-)
MAASELTQELPVMASENRRLLAQCKALGIDKTAKRSPGTFSPERTTGCATSPWVGGSKADRSRVLREATWPRDIDYNLKRSHGGCSPIRSSEENAEPVKERDSRWHEIAQNDVTMKAFGWSPSIETVVHRSAGDYSPQRSRDRSSQRTTARVDQIVDPRSESNRIIGVYSMKPSIDNVPRRGVGEYSPLRQRQPVSPLPRSCSPHKDVIEAMSTKRPSRSVSPANSRRSRQPSAAPSPLLTPTACSERCQSPLPKAGQVPAPLKAAAMRGRADSRDRRFKDGGSAQRQRTPESVRSAGRPTNSTASKLKEPAKGVVPELAPEARGSGVTLSRASTAESSPDLRRSWTAVAERTCSPAPARGLSPCTSLSSGMLPPAIRMARHGAEHVGRPWR